jgi:peptidoglycan/xylan/chitin deacetylase (PgdA/CDA1 family)
MDIINNRDYTYTYPLKTESILPEVRDAIHPGQLTGDPLTAIQSRYLGIYWVDSVAMLPGFNASEIRKLDKKGLIPNSQNMVFLTFDDWGTDRTVMALLDVLRKHNAKATFFVRTNYVTYNPNLLRAIALEGHSIASHTHDHFPLANDVSGRGTKYSDLTPAQAEDLAKDLVTCYQLLQSIVGDIRINGQPALTRLFRPPTLAVSKTGLKTVLDCGFTYSVSGSYTSEDYKAIDANKMASNLKRNTKSGAVMIMHMSDVSVYTADALEIYLQEMAKLPAGKTYRFASLAEVLK